ncbi:hypothetical protein D3C79_840180 [compost metagenome]
MRLVHAQQATHGTFVIRRHAPYLQQLPLGSRSITFGQRDIRQAEQGKFVCRALLACLPVQRTSGAQVLCLQRSLSLAEQGPIPAG